MRPTMKKAKTSRPVGGGRKPGKAYRGARAIAPTPLGPPLVGPLLIAAVRDHPLAGALRLAEALARRGRVAAHVLAAGPPPPGALARPGSLRRAEALARRGRVDAHVLAVVPPLSGSLSALASIDADLEPRELD